MTEQWRILVTGASGQLGQSLQTIAHTEKTHDWRFLNRQELDLCHPDQIRQQFDAFQPHIFINAAAYTAVDQAETDEKQAMQVNGNSLQTIAQCCESAHTFLFQISTDYVYHGEQCTAYLETDPINPQGAYARSKYLGEQLALQFCSRTYIFRTSWLYSPHGNNFVKTMLKLGKEHPELKVVNDQIGTPTYAYDLAQVLLDFIQQINSGEPAEFGIYNFSNEGVASWYDFAVAVFEEAGMKLPVHPVSTSAFPRPAPRPPFSLMDKQKIRSTLKNPIPHWRVSLRNALPDFL